MVRAAWEQGARAHGFEADLWTLERVGERAGDWTPVTRTFRDGHTAIWWAADATLGFWG
ncbi:hypothetical protein FHS40_009115, partial [Streptomyces spectabilis]|nr:hypothetical protein [Streptomyces spectabilis]